MGGFIFWSRGVSGGEKIKKKSHVHEIDNYTDYRMQMT